MPKRKTARVRNERRQTRALQLKAQGKSYRDIVAIIKAEFRDPTYSYSKCLFDCDNALAKAAKENTHVALHKHRALELLRLEDWLDKLYPFIETGDVKAVNAALKISENRSKLIGLYTPVEVKVRQIVSSRIEEELEAFLSALENSGDIPSNIIERIYEIAEEMSQEPCYDDVI